MEKELQAGAERAVAEAAETPPESNTQPDELNSVAETPAPAPELQTLLDRMTAFEKKIESYFTEEPETNNLELMTPAGAAPETVTTTEPLEVESENPGGQKEVETKPAEARRGLFKRR